MKEIAPAGSWNKKVFVRTFTKEIPFVRIVRDGLDTDRYFVVEMNETDRSEKNVCRDIGTKLQGSVVEPFVAFENCSMFSLLLVVGRNVLFRNGSLSNMLTRITVLEAN